MQIEKNLVGTKIILRNYRKEDLKFSTDMWFDEEIGKYMSDPTAAYVDEEYRQALEGLQDSTNGYYLISQMKESDELVGTCCIFPDETREIYDIGYCIEKRFWKQGYGSEMLNLVIEWIKQQGGKKITAEVAVENEASKALLTKFGFEVGEETEFKKYHMDVVYKSYIYQLEVK